MLFAWHLGSIEGRVEVQHIEAQQAKNFTFKCHRDNSDVYVVNTISFHPECNKAVHATFATSGSDGAYNFWDNDSKQRLKVSYDWSKGGENHMPAQAQNFILLHPTQDTEVKAKARVCYKWEKMTYLSHSSGEFFPCYSGQAFTQYAFQHEPGISVVEDLSDHPQKNSVRVGCFVHTEGKMFAVGHSLKKGADAIWQHLYVTGSLGVVIMIYSRGLILQMTVA
ncbi:unnamed protein product [Sphagnum troendelagicum]|uniref:Uncharacterized protein n=1 Tax=Sphagnum troendelagicum TaxID=128251 RepID=A0ABP0TP82_9BRYO